MTANPKGKQVWWAVLNERQVQSPAVDDLIDLAAYSAARGYHRIRRPYGRTDDTRNELAHYFLTQSRRPDDVLVMLDDDHRHPINTVEVLVSANAPVVGAYANMRGAPYTACAFVRGEGGVFHPVEEVEEAVYPVDAIGHAAIAIQRRVFVELEKAGKLFPWWRYDYHEYKVFKASGAVKDGERPRQPSEDMYFSRICREAGIQLYLDGRVRCPHLTYTEITEETFKQHRASLPEDERQHLEQIPATEKRELPIVDLVVPGSDGFEHTRNLLESLKQTEGVKYRVIYVDNGSSLFHLGQFIADYPEVTLIQFGENKGFVQATNAGVEEALTREDSDFVMWLNNDVVIPPGAGDWLLKLLEPFNHPDVAATGPVTDRVSMLQKREGPSEAEGEDAWVDTPILIGYALLLRKSAVREIGPLDERFGMGNFEDWDYSLRLKQAGYRLVVCENVWVQHVMSATHQAKFGQKWFTEQLAKNMQVFKDKWDAATLKGLGLVMGGGDEMWSIRLITHATGEWLPKIAPYLETLEKYSPFENWLLTVDSQANGYAEQFPTLKTAEVPRVAGAPEVTYSLQHGGFLPYVPGSADDVLVYTDGDIVLQRAPTPEEQALLENLPPDAVAVGWNSSPHETLALEASRLGPRVLDLATVFDARLLAAPCFNIGVIAARRALWERIHARYMELYPLAEQVFTRQQRQQWLVCYVLAELNVRVRLLDYTFHMHGCYPLPEGGAVVDGVARYNGEPVLFRHRIP